MGLLTPYIMVFGIYYVLGRDTGELVADIRENLFAESPEPVLSRVSIAALTVSGLMLIVSIVFLMEHINSMKIKSRKTFIFCYGELVFRSFSILQVLCFG